MPTRRTFLQSGLCLSGPLFVGCLGRDEPRLTTNAADANAPDAAAPNPAGCEDPFAGATFLDNERFIDEDHDLFEVPFNEGLDGRLYTDLSKLSEERPLIPNDAFYIRTRYPDQLDPDAPWSIRLEGLVETELDVSLESLIAQEREQGVHLLECSGNSSGASFGLMSSAEWSGVPLLELIERAELREGATSVLVAGFDEHSQPSAGDHSTPGASWIFTFDQLRKHGAFLATRMNGEPLPADHGAPVRLVMPGWYGCTCIKWVDRIRIVGEDEPSTSQMREFASRTHQSAVHDLAREFSPARMDVAAMPIRVERWRVGERTAHRIVGIVWGGEQPVDTLELRLGDGPWQRVDVCSAMPTNATWMLWSTRWEAPGPGVYPVVLRVPDPNVRTRRLDSQYYLRELIVSG